MKTVIVDAMVDSSEYGTLKMEGASLAPLLVEVVVYAGLYHLVLLRWLSPMVRKWLLNSSFGQSATAIKEGAFMQSLLEDATFCFTISLHHLVSGSFMFLGFLNNSVSLWLHGIAMEMGYELVDTFAILSNSWPYSVMTRPYLKILAIAHHIPTLLVIPVLVRLGYHSNKDVQTLGWSLIGAGGLGFLAEGLKKTFDKEIDMKKWFSIHGINAIVMFVLRMVLFPSAALRALSSIKSDSRAKTIYPVCLGGFIAIQIFNVVLMVLYLAKFVLNMRRLVAAATRRAVSMPQKLYNMETTAKQT